MNAQPFNTNVYKCVQMFLCPTRGVVATDPVGPSVDTKKIHGWHIHGCMYVHTQGLGNDMQWSRGIIRIHTHNYIYMHNILSQVRCDDLKYLKHICLMRKTPSLTKNFHLVLSLQPCSTQRSGDRPIQFHNRSSLRASGTNALEVAYFVSV